MGIKFNDDTGAWLDGYLIDWMNHARKAVAKKWDYVVLVDGVEGSGKSGLAITCAHYLDPSFSHERIVFTPEQFIESVDKSTPGQAIVWDEFVLGGLSDDALREIQTTIIKKMVTIRKKRLYIFLVIPYIFMLRAYFAVGRTRLLIHTYSEDGLSRGNFRLYNYDRKKSLFFKGKKFYDYGFVAPTKRGSFGNAANWPMIDWAAYESKKDDATDTIQVGDVKTNKYREALKKMVVYSKERLSVTDKQLADICGIGERTISRFNAEKKILEEKSLPVATSIGGNTGGSLGGSA